MKTLLAQSITFKSKKWEFVKPSWRDWREVKWNATGRIATNHI